MSTESVEERLARIEATLPHLATNSGLQRLKVEILLALIGIAGVVIAGLKLLEELGG